MTALKLDARMPVVVMVGDFNPAIFSTMWVAQHLHGYAEGDVIEGAEVLMEVAPGALARLQFINGVALVVAPNRLDSYVVDHNPEQLSTLERVLTNLIKVLPHTPLRGVGCNFHFTDDDPADALLELFESREGIEGEYVVRSRSSGAQMEVGDAVLNLTRILSDGKVQFAFNYHHALADPAEYEQLIPGLVERSREHALGTLRSLYKLENHELVGFAPAVGTESDNDEDGGEGALEANDIQG